MIEKTDVAVGITWISVPEVDLHVLCGCPEDAVKHLMRRGLIVPKESDGVSYETGPNAILLSDVPVQSGSFANLSEFPVLQMFYRQGMLIPNHPNNTGARPLLVGNREQVHAQSQYIYRGNYGLASIEELQAAGASKEEASALMRIKLRFAFDRIRDTTELLDTRIVEDEPLELRDGVFIQRKALNVYEFRYRDASLTVDLNLAWNETYEPPYQLGYHTIGREYFSVVHLGEGDGWDVNRPCMSSLITHQGRYYLIDTGPNIHHSLKSLGISINELDGIFHTHAHDDHFCGFTSLVSADQRIQHYSTPLVRASVLKKLAALTGFDESRFEHYIQFRELRENEWNNIDGLEVKPVFSPHPLETTVFFFRTMSDSGYKTYAHLADTVALDVLEDMVTDDVSASGVSAETLETVRQTYAEPADLKKVDVGGGMIHGRAADYVDDESKRILFSHVARPLTHAEMEIGSNASFGMQDVLIPARQDYAFQEADRYLGSYFPTAQPHHLQLLLNNPIVSFNVGTILIRRGEQSGYVYLVLGGMVEYMESGGAVHNVLSAGALLGDLAGLLESEAKGTYRAASNVEVLKIPRNIYAEFVVSCDLLGAVRRKHALRQFLKRTYLFGEVVSHPMQDRIAQSMELWELGPDDLVPSDHEGEPQLVVVDHGSVAIFCGDTRIEGVGPGGCFGEEALFSNAKRLFTARCLEKTRLYCLALTTIKDIPSVRWKLQEFYDRRVLSRFTMC
jgi:hemerythrin